MSERNGEVSMSSSKKTVLVLGGYGFIGRHIVSVLKRQAWRVLIGTRGVKPSDSARAERRLKFHEMHSCADWMPVLSQVDAVVNAVGILRERRGETYEQVHHYAVKTLGDACAKKQIPIVHISAMCIEQTEYSKFSGSKLCGENALMASGANCWILRASLVEGEGAFGWSWFKRTAQWPVPFVPARRALISPIRV